VIIDAIKESRRIFQRMNSYAIYRIAETLRVLFFMTLAILVFNFYPLTAVMIVMLALLNDGAILSIAYDNVHYKNKPESWNMRMVLGVSTALGIIGVVSAFGLFYLGERVFHLDRPHIQTLMYLKLSVAGHLTIFLTRTRGPFWSIRPAKILWMAVLGTQIVATLIAVYGLFMTPLGWGWAAFVWGYALLWFLVNDRIKLLAYRIFDPVKIAGTKSENNVATQLVAQSDRKTTAQPEAKADPQAGAKDEVKPEVNDGSKPNAQAEAKPGADDQPKPKAKAEIEARPVNEPKPEAKARTTVDLNTQIAARAYELYEREGHQAGRSAQNWDQAEQEIRATQAKAEPKAEATPAPKAVSTSGAKAEPEPEIKSDAKPAAIGEAKPDAKTETKLEAKLKPVGEASPQLVQRVHKFYEQLGREDVRAVQKSDEAEQPKISEVETNK